MFVIAVALVGDSQQELSKGSLIKGEDRIPPSKFRSSNIQQSSMGAHGGDLNTKPDSFYFSA